MPIYEYLCQDCGHELEALQKMSDDALVFCPECHAESLKKKISAVAFKLKGTGWYETDFKNSGKKPEQKSVNKSNKTAPSSESGVKNKAQTKKTSQAA